MVCSPLENKEGVIYNHGIIQVVALKKQLIYLYEEKSLLIYIYIWESITVDDFKFLY